MPAGTKMADTPGSKYALTWAYVSGDQRQVGMSARPHLRRWHLPKHLPGRLVQKAGKVLPPGPSAQRLVEVRTAAAIGDHRAATYVKRN